MESKQEQHHTSKCRQSRKIAKYDSVKTEWKHHRLKTTASKHYQNTKALRIGHITMAQSTTASKRTDRTMIQIVK